MFEVECGLGMRSSGGPLKVTWVYPESGGLFLFHKVVANLNNPFIWGRKRNLRKS